MPRVEHDDRPLAERMGWVQPKVGPTTPPAEKSNGKSRKGKRDTSTRWHVLNTFVDRIQPWLLSRESTVWLHLFRMANVNNTVVAPHSLLVGRTRLSLPTVKRAVHSLVRMKLIRVVRMGNAARESTEYLVLAPDDWRPQHDPR